MRRNTLLGIGLFLAMGIFIRSDSAGKWFGLSASDFHKTPEKRGFRKEILQIPRHQKGSFHRFLELYDRAVYPAEKMKIMKTYYENYSERHFELLSLIYFFHAYDPRSPVCEKILFRFVSDHHFQKDVLAVLFASYSTLSGRRAMSFQSLLEVLYKRCPDMTMPNLETLHFVDLMVSQELEGKSTGKLRGILVKLWKRELGRDTILESTAGEWIRKVISYYTLRQNHAPLFRLGIRDFLAGKHKLFGRFGYSPQQIVDHFWNQFQIPARAYSIPEFIPGLKNRDLNSNHTKNREKVRKLG